MPEPTRDQRQDQKRKPELHQSQIVQFINCGMQYQYRYVDGLRTRPGIALITGTSTHKSVEVNLRNKIEHGVLLDEEQVADVARDTVNQVWEQEGVFLAEEEREEGEEVMRGSTVDTAVALARLHHNELAPRIEPVAVERQFTLELVGRPVNLAGTIDIEEADGIRDTKTYAKRPSRDDVDRSIQLDLYALAKKTLDGKSPKRISLDILLKNKVPTLVTLETQRDDLDYQRLLLRVDAVTSAIQAGNFLPTTPDNWRCSAKYCGYFDHCPFGRRKQTKAAVNGMKNMDQG